MLTSTEPFASVLVDNIGQIRQIFQILLPRVDQGRWGAPPLKVAAEICLFRVAMAETSWFAEVTSLPNDVLSVAFVAFTVAN